MVALRIVFGVIGVVVLLGGVAWFVPSSVTVSRVFKAKPEQMWAFWDSPATIGKWWGPRNYSAPLVKSDLKQGGAFLLVMRSPGGAETSNVGAYLEVSPGKRIVQAMSFADAAGNALPGASAPVPGRWPDSVKVTTEFFASDGGAEVRVHEEGVPLIMKFFARLGWEQQFDKIEALLGEP